jgi:hypothetical protein
MSDYDDDKPNWRELDRQRDKSGFYGRHEKKEKGEGASRDKPKDRWQTGKVKEAIDRIFMGKKGTLEHDKLYKKLHQSYGMGTFGRHVLAYIEKFGVPDDAPTLLLIFDAKDPGISLRAIEKLHEVFPALSQEHKDDVLRKLSIVAQTDRSREVRMRAEELIGELT